MTVFLLLLFSFVVNWSIYWDVPRQSQWGLTFNGHYTANGCAPTSASMITAYWHEQGHGQHLDPQWLIDQNAAEGQFHNWGMSATYLWNELWTGGYDTYVHWNSSKAELVEALRQGPVVAIVKSGMSRYGTVHNVVLVGVSTDGRWVAVNDPWCGCRRVYSWSRFAASWGSWFRGGTVNHFMEILPVDRADKLW